MHLEPSVVVSTVYWDGLFGSRYLRRGSLFSTLLVGILSGYVLLTP